MTAEGYSRIEWESDPENLDAKFELLEALDEVSAESGNIYPEIAKSDDYPEGLSFAVKQAEDFGDLPVKAIFEYSLDVDLPSSKKVENYLESYIEDFVSVDELLDRFQNENPEDYVRDLVRDWKKRSSETVEIYVVEAENSGEEEKIWVLGDEAGVRSVANWLE